MSKEIQFDSDFQTFLETQKPKTQQSYKGFLHYWMEFTGWNGKESLDFKRKDKDALTEKKVLSFHKWLIEKKGKSENTAKTMTGCIRGFYSSNRLPLKFIKQERTKLGEANRVTEDYKFSKQDLYKMQEQGDLEEKWIILGGKSVGLRASDFLAFTYGHFRALHLDEDAPVYVGEIKTTKEHVKANPFLDSDAIPIIKALLERHPEAKDQDRILPFKDEQPLNLAIHRTFEAAHLVSGGKQVRFHCLRKYLIDRLSAVASESQWKQIVGKKISEGAYVSTEQLREIYSRAMPNIVVNGGSRNHVALEKVETDLAKAEQKIEAQNTELRTLRQMVATLSARQEELERLVKATTK